MSARRPLYGLIIDARHHLWDLSGDHCPWLTKSEAAIPALGDIGLLRRNYPVTRRWVGDAELCTRFREVAAEYAPVEQHALFYSTASRLYGIMT